MTTQEEQEAELLKQGDDAENLLNHPSFKSVINNLVETSFQNFVNSKPDDGASRERTYQHYRALVDVTNTLHQRVAVRDEILAQQNDARDNNGDE